MLHHCSFRCFVLYIYLRASYVSPADIVFGGVCECVCLFAQNLKKLPISNQCNLVGICPTVNARSVWKLVTFDLDL